MIETHFLLPLYLLLLQGCLGAFDTLYYHEWKCRLPQNRRSVAPELKLHGVRDLIYAVIFCGLPTFQWGGGWAWVLVFLLVSEIAITLKDFVIEREVRVAIGGLENGELIMHTLMAILYGVFIATLVPHIIEWSSDSTGLIPHESLVPNFLWYMMMGMGIGVGLAGIRDLWLAYAP